MPATKRQILNGSVPTKYWKRCCQGIIGTLRCLSRCQVIRRCYAVSMGFLFCMMEAVLEPKYTSMLNTKISSDQKSKMG